MAALTVLVTGGGAPGIAGTIYSLRQNWEQRPLRIVCCDMSDEVVGRYLSDACFRVPSARDPDFMANIEQLCQRERVDVIVPQVTAELALFAAHKAEFARRGVRVAVSDRAAIESTNDKFALAQHARGLGVTVPACVLVDNWSALLRAAADLGYPRAPFAVKQPSGNGMRGYRAIFAALDRKQAFYEQKPDSSRATLDELHAVLGDDFPALMVMEYLPGTEYSVDVLADGERVYAVIPRERTRIRSGITFEARTAAHPQLIADCKQLAQSLRLGYAFGFQFKEDAEGRPKLLECNPRVQGTMVVATFAGANVIYGAVKLAMGEALPDFDVSWSTTFMRYWGGIGVTRDEVGRL
jgi:carbamoyl-phosphate synthase large subunit